ncbi:hypothetical protein GCM10010123_19240 [Pilimelia anulata]|uniref:FtsX extracellular domain-containing protein n=1 Tax=Pilimelia anulata TaxID=53371 RepID=A0A8J3B929_9ACTN|nr:permease-like cell division protein FtsX [Pilimelia anulata]GGJ89662.1 hypothetical protein GCM10010123_19240 [Pilimelia anulata]
MTAPTSKGPTMVTSPVPASPVPAAPPSPDHPRRRGSHRRPPRRWLLVAAAVLLAGAAGSLLLLLRPGAPAAGPPRTMNVYLRADATPAQQAAVRAALVGDRRLADVRFVDRAAALAHFRETFGEVDPDLVARTRGGDLPESFRAAVRPDVVDHRGVVAAYCALAGVERADIPLAAAGSRPVVVQCGN